MFFSFVYSMAFFSFLIIMGAFLLFSKPMNIPQGFLVVPILLFLGERIGLGYYGNALYCWTVKKRINKGYHLLEKYRPTSIVAIIFPFFIWIADIISHELQFVKFIGNEANAETIHAYLNPNKRNHWAVKTANVSIVVLWIFAVAILVGVSKYSNRIDEQYKTSSFADKIEDLRYSPKKMR